MKTEIDLSKQNVVPTPGINPKTTAAVLFEEEDGEIRSYVMHFRAGNRPPMSKAFLNKGGLPDAIDRAKKHCERMNYRFCGCYPFIVDLDLQERLRYDELGLGEL